MKVESKLPWVGTTIFTVMSALANEYGAINLSQGFPNFDCPERLKFLVNEYMQRGLNQYAPMPGVPALRQQIASKIENLYNAPVNPDMEITVTAGATQALFCAIAAFVKPGDEVILIEPAYDSYRPSIEVNGGVAVAYELAAPDFRVDWEALKKLVNRRTRMIIVNNPHNPTGKVFSKDDLLSLQKIAVENDLLVLSDEVYEHLVFDGRQHESVLAYPELFARSLVTFSFGKTFHNTGWKIGYCVAPEPLMREFRKVHQFNVFAVNTPMQYAIADFLEDPQEYLHLPDFYQMKRDYFFAFMRESRFCAVACEGTYFQLFDYSDISDLPDFDFVKKLITDHGVAAIPISVFYSSGRNERIIRLCFAKTEETLRQAGERLRAI